MRAYADTSFLVKLLAQEPDSESAAAEYRRLDYPPLFFLPLHALEVRNAIHQRAFHQRRSAEPNERKQITREKAAALSKLDRMLERRAFLAVSAEWDAVVARARELAELYTERAGARTYDIQSPRNFSKFGSERRQIQRHAKDRSQKGDGFFLARSGLRIL